MNIFQRVGVLVLFVGIMAGTAYMGAKVFSAIGEGLAEYNRAVQQSIGE